ncbi:response regulator transcription factor [Aquincola tertiaricarbonis]|uniref:Response regulator transcription factor n=1 Tax=Aquincola tertiaricarbonis TaxID=391953 RepID=A0ABY4S1L8_AQUTE|nr:response regulator transcription factor [Aquincola tertiaricarbonis]URI07027.1 response regulator transcription factor [Aquincola tertiaricarbonis]
MSARDPMNLGRIVLVVDDAPQSLGPLVAALEDDGYTVLVARDGAQALERLGLVVPDAILLDAVMPGLSGFETCRRVKADPALSHIPVIFMTGLSETTHIVEGFDSGGVDYVVKPLQAPEVLARLATHVRNARSVRLAREAVDVAGFGVLVLDNQGRMAWRSPQAAAWLRALFPDEGAARLTEMLQALAAPAIGTHECVAPDGRVLTVQPLGPAGLGERMLLLQLRAATAEPPTRLRMAALTPREAEVLSWVAKGKTNRDVAEILGMSPRTVNKHLEHVFEKLGVETRAAAAALASRGGV